MSEFRAKTLAAIRSAPTSSLVGDFSKNALSFKKPEFNKGKNSSYTFAVTQLGVVEQVTMPKYTSGQRYELLLLLVDVRESGSSRLELN